ncbi:uncharacterized protein STEHIDRAFT_154020, partial [Stereum hirsutum FP-91666 SS1]|uniref:uncharacterized protein n=1 Tax=Stereum hirsutum (strain FP-91666) TaxID=721885 RepID=UPI000441007E
KSTKARYSSQLSPLWTSPAAQSPTISSKVDPHTSKRAYERREQQSFPLIVYHTSHTDPKICTVDDCQAYPKWSLAEKAAYLLSLGFAASDPIEVYRPRYRYWELISLTTVHTIAPSSCLVIRRNSEVMCDNLDRWISDVQGAARTKSPLIWDNVGAERARVSALHKQRTPTTRKRKADEMLGDLDDEDQATLKRIRRDYTLPDIPKIPSPHLELLPGCELLPFILADDSPELSLSPFTREESFDPEPFSRSMFDPKPPARLDPKPFSSPSSSTPSLTPSSPLVSPDAAIRLPLLPADGGDPLEASWPGDWYVEDVITGLKAIDDAEAVGGTVEKRFERVFGRKFQSSQYYKIRLFWESNRCTDEQRKAGRNAKGETRGRWSVWFKEVASRRYSKTKAKARRVSIIELD